MKRARKCKQYKSSRDLSRADRFGAQKGLTGDGTSQKKQKLRSRVTAEI
jgi:hypothetical protein